MKRSSIRVVFAAWAAIAALGLAAVAEARNEHCAGGIQYVVQAMRDKEKGNLDDYHREISKAVQQLEMCAEADTADYESIGYLGWASAEVDSARQAGLAFQRAIAGLTAKGDKKKLEMVTNNRNSYWSKSFNEGIAAVKDAQNAYPDFCKPPATDADRTLRGEAEKKYAAAITSLRNASYLRPDDALTIRNIGTTYALTCRYEEAEAMFKQGLALAPNDSDLVRSIASVRSTRANRLLEEEKFDEAIAYFGELTKQDPTNADSYSGLADAYFKRAQKKEGDARKPDFKAAGDAYAKAGELRANNADLPFNAALAYQNAGETALSEGQWRQTLKLRPDDADAMSSLGAVLADQKKFDEAVSVLHRAVVQDPKNKERHRQLGAAFTKAGSNAKATEELMVYLALKNGQPAADADAAAKKTAASTPDAAKTLAAQGAPEQVVPWDADGQKYETWFYWSKKSANHFQGGKQVQKSDWSTVSVPKSTASAGKK